MPRSKPSRKQKKQEPVQQPQVQVTVPPEIMQAFSAADQKFMEWAQTNSDLNPAAATSMLAHLHLQAAGFMMHHVVQGLLSMKIEVRK